MLGPFVYLVLKFRERNFAFTLENNNLLIKQSHSHCYKKGCFAVRSCTRYVYLIFAVNLAAYMFDGVFGLFSWWCCTARFKAVLLYVVIQDRYLSITA